MERLGLILKVVLAAFAFAIYIWIEAVRRTPGVRRRKAQRILTPSEHGPG